MNRATTSRYLKTKKGLMGEDSLGVTTGGTKTRGGKGAQVPLDERYIRRCSQASLHNITPRDQGKKLRIIALLLPLWGPISLGNSGLLHCQN